MRYACLILSLSALSFMGCDDTDEFATDRLEMNVVITDEGEGSAEISVHLSQDGEGLELSDGDALTAVVGGAEHALSRKSDASALYHAEGEALQGGEEIVIKFEREDHDSAEGTRVRVPEAFTLTAPADDDTLPLDDTIAVTWDGSGEDSMTLTVEGECIEDINVALDKDVGRYLIHPGEIERVDSGGGACPVWLSLERARRGHVDVGFEGGSITARQIRRRAIYLN